MNLEMQDALLEAVIALSNIPFAPQSPSQHDALMYSIAAFADRPDGLAWAVQQAVTRWNRWLGPAELRAIYCTRFRPADGIETDVFETPGLRPSDNETAYFEEQAQATAARIEDWKRQAAQLPAAEQEANRQLVKQLELFGKK